MEDKISVIVCTYNQETTIARTLDSILMQQCHVPYEIVIGEDCSTDKTPDICRQYAEQHPDTIRLIENKHNKGLINNYFDCLLSCQGNYIADCAGDDFWTDPQKLEKEVRIFETHKHVTLVHTDWEYYDESSKTTYPSPQKPFTAPITSGKDMLVAIITQTSIPVIHLCTSLYRKDIVCQALHDDEYLFRNKEFGCEDIQIIFLMALHGDIAYIADKTLNYSVGHESVSCSNDHIKQFRFTKGVSSLSHYLAEKYHIDHPDIAQYFSQRIIALAMHAFREHDASLFAETQKCEKEWHVHRNTTIRTLFFIMRHEWLWTMGLQFRKSFVALKRLFH